MFRVPKSDPIEDKKFYQNQYREGFTTECPSDQELARLQSVSFKGTEKDYSAYIEVIRATGLRPNDSILDFGCSWGYGSWQLSKSGFRVYSYEISKPRAQYAAEKLHCRLIASSAELPEKVDCLFSAHVIEHLANPRVLWEMAEIVLKPKGKVVLFMPNGDPEVEDFGTRRYHQLWGQVHPLLISGNALMNMANAHGFTGRVYSSPYDATKIQAGVNDGLTGEELLLIAERV
jgi:2-polyprenyl-3-methyl-5-hydroxy-6-metoxy-1,4-benzoquinol methylase